MRELVLVSCLLLLPGQPPANGPKPGERLAPYMSIVSVGSQRGQHHCFV